VQPIPSDFNYTHPVDLHLQVENLENELYSIHSQTTSERQEFTRLRQEYIRMTTENALNQSDVIEQTDRLSKYLKVATCLED